MTETGDMTTARPAGDLLAADTTMGAVTLHVGDLALMVDYYRDALALTEIPALAGPGRVALGRGASPVVVLQHTPGLPATARNQAGLFHTAILFESPATLAAAVAHAARHPLSRFVGNADHWVSRAFYFTDPEDNGIELYWDRPRDTWRRTPDGVAMGSDWFDPQGFLAEHLNEDVLADAPGQGAQVGHVHLQVGDIPAARAFYVDALGFEVMATFHGALFMAAGGYHHHVAVNTWNSAGAGPRAATLGLGQMALTVPTADEVGALRDRLRHAGVAARDDGRTLRFEDPWNTLVEVGVG
jgi:catechol 2,3-dioxygenase